MNLWCKIVRGKINTNGFNIWCMVITVHHYIIKNKLNQVNDEEFNVINSRGDAI